MHIAFDNSYARDLPGTYVAWQPAAVPAPTLLYLNRELAGELGLDAGALASAEGIAMLAGNRVPDGAEPIAQAYAGHQFGGFSPQLGDGRALLLGEVIDRHGRRRDIAFKGSGRTPFSRGGDGKAAVGPMLREVLIGEAMHALGIPTTRALAVVATGEPVVRDTVLPGAVLTRVASSHLRVGSLQYFAARGDLDTLRRMADYAIARHDPGLALTREPCLGLLQAVAQRQARLVAQWMNVGFIHGVMNTDNMAVSGETIDYGPCAFIEAYDPAAVFSSIDHQGRYAYGNQPAAARWNLARLAEALLPLMCNAGDESAVRQAVAQATAVIDGFPAQYAQALLQGQRTKLGLARADDGDAALVDDWLGLLQRQRVDFTLGWRRLADAAAGDANPLRALFAQADALNPWLQRWHARCAGEGAGALQRAQRMRRASPWLIARNHRVEEALAAASDHGELQAFEALLAALQRPFDEDAPLARYAQPAPAETTAGYRTFCGT
ncbi:MAG TPA: YdiU family protein [Rubrivivax sp.]|nr:YdiU family protein [Rubrivivax sp.]HPO19800.1 YdiU family protein [Rubrivivax sp.]